MEKFIKKIKEKLAIFNIKHTIKMFYMIVLDTIVNVILIIIIAPLLLLGSLTFVLLHIGEFFTNLKDC